MLKPVDFLKGFPIVFRWIPGLLMAAGVAVIAYVLSQWPWLQQRGLGVLTLSVLLGLLIGNALPKKMRMWGAAGFFVCKNTVLRVGVALYGLRISLMQVADIGLSALLLDVLIMFTTMLSCVALARYVLKMELRSALVLGAGHAVCGAAAILASNSIIRAKESEVAIAIACVVLFGTGCMLLYPWLFQAMHLDAKTFGVLTGATVHEVAQVVAIGQSLGEDVTETAVVTKLVRVLLLAPFIIFLHAWLSRQTQDVQPAEGQSVPWFVLGFVGCLLLNSWMPLPELAQHIALQVDDGLLAVAMAALGLGTPLSALTQSGIKPLLLAAFLTAQLILMGGLFVLFVF